MILLPHLAAVKLQNFFGVFLQFQIGVDTFLRVCKGFGECSSPSRPKDATPQPGVPAKSQTLWGKEEQGSERSFRRKAETEMSGLCDDARTTPERCISAPLETDVLLLKLNYR